MGFPTSKPVYSEPYILDEGSDKTLGGFFGKDKSSDDSVAKLLVKDPYHELKKESVFTDRIDQFVPENYGDISYPIEEIKEPYHYHIIEDKIKDEPSPYPYNTAFNDQDHSTNNNYQEDPWRSGRKMTLPVIKNDNFPGIVKHISTYTKTGRSLSSASEDLVDFGAATGGHGSFGWYSDHPVGTRINEGLFA